MGSEMCIRDSSGTDYRPTVKVNFLHQPLSSLVRVPEIGFKHPRHIAHQVHGIIPHHRVPLTGKHPVQLGDRGRSVFGTGFDNTHVLRLKVFSQARRITAPRSKNAGATLEHQQTYQTGQEQHHQEGDNYPGHSAATELVRVRNAGDYVF